MASLKADPNTLLPSDSNHVLKDLSRERESGRNLERFQGEREKDETTRALTPGEGKSDSVVKDMLLRYTFRISSFQ